MARLSDGEFAGIVLGELTKCGRWVRPSHADVAAVRSRRNMRLAGLSVAELLQCLRNQLRPHCPSAAPWAVAHCGEHLLQLIDKSLVGDRALDEVQQRLSGVFADHRILRIGRRRSYSARCSLSASLMAES